MIIPLPCPYCSHILQITKHRKRSIRTSARHSYFDHFKRYCPKVPPLNSYQRGEIVDRLTEGLT